MMSQLGTLASKNSTRKPELMELSTININEFITISFFFNRQLLIMIIYVLAPNFTKKWTIILCGAGSVVLLMASHRRLNGFTEVRNTLTHFFCFLQSPIHFFHFVSTKLRVCWFFASKATSSSSSFSVDRRQRRRIESSLNFFHTKSRRLWFINV